MLKVNEIFPSIQGEGSQAGQGMVFVRLSNCNLSCEYCDTKYHTKGEMMAIDAIVAQCLEYELPWVCLTGGEPTIQTIEPLIAELNKHGFLIAIESNGTMPIPDGIDHIVVSPKTGHDIEPSIRPLVNEWKYVICDESDFDRIEYEAGVYLQPVDNNMEIARLCVEKILKNPGWRLSLQLHKLLGVR